LLLLRQLNMTNEAPRCKQRGYLPELLFTFAASGGEFDP